MELIMLAIALFVFIFGSIVALQTIEFAIRVGDKTLESSGVILRLPFKVTLMLIFFVGKHLFRLLKRSLHKEVKVTPIQNVTPLDVQFASNDNLLQSGKRAPVLIENPPQKQLR